MRHARFIGLLLGYAGAMALAALGINFAIDPFDVFGHGMLKEVGQPQERFLKIEVLRAHPSFNTIVLGSSRAGVIRADDMDAAIDGARTYNLSVSQANQWDNEKLVEWLVERYRGARRIILQVDWPSSYGESKPGYALLTATHPEISGRGRASFLLDYLTYFSMEAMLEKVAGNMAGRNRLEYDFARGNWSRPARDRMIDVDCEAYVRSEPAFRALPTVPTDRNVIRLNIEALERITNLLERRGLSLVIVLTPHSQRFLDSIAPSDYEYFLRGVARLGPVRNLMFYSPLTTNDCNYYELNHYRPKVGRLVAEVAAGRDHPDFARTVRADNLNAEAEFALRNFESHRRTRQGDSK